MLSAILAAITAIPQLLSALQSLLDYMKKAEAAGFFAQQTAAFQQLKDAKTDAEYISAAKAISDTLRRA